LQDRRRRTEVEVKSHLVLGQAEAAGERKTQVEAKAEVEEREEEKNAGSFHFAGSLRLQKDSG
jgi:hypothetical protein